MATIEEQILSCERTYGAVEDDLSKRLTQIVPMSSRQTPQMAKLQAYMDVIRKRKQNTGSLHSKVFSLPEAIFQKHIVVLITCFQTASKIGSVMFNNFGFREFSLATSRKYSPQAYSNHRGI